MADSGNAKQPLLRPLLETFPAEIYPLREIGTGFTVQWVEGDDAISCAAVAAEMMDESRGINLSTASSDGGSVGNYMAEGQPFLVPDLPLPEGNAKDGLLILRNERLFPGMVGIALPLHGILWVREDGTFNCSGFFRRQIPKFETAALVAAVGNMKEFHGVYHVLYRPVVEAAAPRLQFKVLRTVLEAGLQFYQEESPARTQLTELRRRVMKLRAEAKERGVLPMESESSVSQNGSTANIMEARRRSTSQSEANNERGGRGSGSICAGYDSCPDKPRASTSSSGEISDGALGDMSGTGADRSGRAVSKATSDSSERSSKIAQQVVTNAPKQNGPFRLWKSDKGAPTYDKSRPS